MVRTRSLQARVIGRRRSHRPDSRGRGASLTEMAIILPVLVLFAFVPLQLNSMIHLKEALSVAAYESAKLATRKLGSRDEAVARYQEIINERQVRGASIEFRDASGATVNPDDLDTGDMVTAVIQAPFDQNSFLDLWYQDKRPTAIVTMIKE